MTEPYENRSRDRESELRQNPDARPLGRFPLAMSYVPWQRFEKLYDEKTALYRGTAFPSLDLPFCAGEVR